ncbi:MAG: hypothetical protein U5M23_16180 [Marinagarivorans sp.]|nr:hypothetical protein [Marinagarivorans sp.]
MAKFPNQSVWLQNWTLNWSELLVYVEGDQYSGDYFVGDAKKVEFLTRARPTIMAKDIQVVATKYPAADGLIIPALITIPTQHAQKSSNYL